MPEAVTPTRVMPRAAVLGHMTIQSLSRTTLTLVLLLTAHAFAAPAGAQIHNHGDTGLGMDHAMLASSVPSDGAELDEAPDALTLTFRHALRLEALSMRTGAGEVVSLSWDGRRRAISHALALPDLAPGVYWVTFTAVSEAGETMPGVLHFTVR